MSFLRINVDQTNVNYETWFIYTIDISFSGLTVPLSPVLLETTLPVDLDYTLPATGSVLKNITTTSVTEGNKITFDFGTISATGISTSLQLKCRFKQTTTIPSSFILMGSLFINELTSPYLIAYGEEVFLSVTTEYTLTTSMVIPSSHDAALGGSVIFQVVLENIGEQWGAPQDFVITYDLSSTLYLTYDPSFVISGKDISVSTYRDSHCDGVAAVTLSNNNGFTLTLSGYRGTVYRFFFKADIIYSEVSINEITLTGDWTIDTLAQAASLYTFPIVQPSYRASLEVTGPFFVQANNYMKYSSSLMNTGNQSLTGVLLEYELPSSQLLDYRIDTGAFYYTGIDIPYNYTYTIKYATEESPDTEYALTDASHPDGIYNLNSSSTLLLSNTNAANQKIRYLRWYMGSMPIGLYSAIWPAIDAYAVSTIALGTTLSFTGRLSWLLADGSLTTSNKLFETTVSQLSELYISSHNIMPTTPVVPGDLLTITSYVDCRYSQLNLPILINILPEKLQFYRSSATLKRCFYMELYSPLTRMTINSTDEEATFPFPTFEVIENYNGTMQTMIRLSFTKGQSYSFLQWSRLMLRFQVKVRVGALGSFSDRLILGNEGALGSTIISPYQYTEPVTLDTDGDTIQGEVLALSSPATGYINDYTSIRVYKKSKGQLDSEFLSWPALATSIPGGTIYYELYIENDGNRNIDSIELVDIIPHINDVGVILIDEQRHSEFPIYQATQVKPELFNADGTTALSPPELIIEYSRSYDPVRFGQSGGSIGTVDDWTATEPDPITDIGAYKVTTSTVPITPGQYLRIQVVCLIPVDVQMDQKAWNSYAILANYTDVNGNATSLLPTEPAMAGVVVSDPINSSIITGRTWLDRNHDGYYQEDEPGINDVGVILYKVNGDYAEAIDSTITISNSYGEKGYFRFYLSEPGYYMLRFAPNLKKYSYTVQRREITTGSQENESTGFTPIYHFIDQTTTLTLFAGFYNFRTPTFVKEINKAANKTLRSSIYSQMLLGTKLEEVMNLLK